MGNVNGDRLFTMLYRNIIFDRFASCGHERERKCFERLSELNCTEPCVSRCKKFQVLICSYAVAKRRCFVVIDV